MRPSLVIFDCDGVLVNTEPLTCRLLAGAVTRLGWPMSYEDARRAFLGLSMQDILLLIERRILAPLPHDWYDEFVRLEAEAFRRHLETVPNVEPVLQAVVAAQVPLCVASSGTMEKINLTLGLTGLKDFFGGRIFSATMVERGKPYPDLFLYAAKTMEVSPADCAVIEDSVNGVRAAVAAGMKAYAYASEHAPDPLQDVGGHIFRRMDELVELLGLSDCHDVKSGSIAESA